MTYSDLELQLALEHFKTDMKRTCDLNNVARSNNILDLFETTSTRIQANNVAISLIMDLQRSRKPLKP